MIFYHALGVAGFLRGCFGGRVGGEEALEGVSLAFDLRLLSDGLDEVAVAFERGVGLLVEVGGGGEGLEGGDGGGRGVAVLREVEEGARGVARVGGGGGRGAVVAQRLQRGQLHHLPLRLARLHQEYALLCIVNSSTSFASLLGCGGYYISVLCFSFLVSLVLSLSVNLL